MFFRAVLLIIALSTAAAATVAAQQASPAPTPPAPTPPAPEAAKPTPTPVKKANERPAPKAPAEPFDGADVKKMAGQCVSLDTESGLIVLEMYPESAPESVRNFLNLAATGAFDTTTFSRVVPGFVIQGGDLYTSEKRTPAMGWRSRRTIPDEPNRILHERGVLSMARPDEANSATTHFFILLMAVTDLDGKFAAFGRVISGMEVVETINKMPAEPGNREKPEKPVRIKKATVAPCAAPVSTSTSTAPATP